MRQIADLTEARMARGRVEVRLDADQVPVISKRLADLNRIEVAAVRYNSGYRVVPGGVVRLVKVVCPPTDELMLQLMDLFGDRRVRLCKEERVH